MTATIVDDLTHTASDKNRECKGQGIANIVSSLMGGMAGCAMIGQSMINIKSGGRGRLSTLSAGVFLLVMVVFLSDWLKQIPMAALVAVMIMVSIGTFSWDSIRNLKEHPLTTNIVMIATVLVVVFTHNLALGVITGVLLASLFFANEIRQFTSVRCEKSNDLSGYTYTVTGQVFFASSDQFMHSFDFKEDVEKIVIDLTHAHFWDITAVTALDKVVIKYRNKGICVDVIGMNEASSTIIGKFGLHHNQDGPIDMQIGGH